MSIVRPDNGARPETADNLDLDVGVVWININREELFDVADPTTVIARATSLPWNDPNTVEKTPYKGGATKGGIEYNPGITQRQVEFDGRRSNHREMWRVDMVEPTLKMNFLEGRDPDILQKYHGAATRETVGIYERIRPDYVVDEDRDFWWNIAVLQTVSGYLLPKMYLINNPHVSANEAVSQSDKNEGVLPVTVTGNTPIADAYGTEYSAAEVWTPLQLAS